ncbi:DUF1028 domain-containing protein [Puteibacter caeruleilacunae]|nr:DUF1028 domain-containing protein [Puteibacter caeruleilacunae]
MKQSIISFLLFISSISLFGQVDFENKYSTFGIIAVDTVDNTWGCAFATNNIAIGQAGVYEIAPDKGIIASIAYTNPNYPLKGIELLKQGESLTMVFDSISKTDNFLFYRQIAMLDSAGNTLGFTGSTIKSCSHAGTLKGNGYVVLGNSLANDTVLKAIENGFVGSADRLYKRLLRGLKAGQEAGGQATGKMSAAMCVKRSGLLGFNDVDYRVDYSETPFNDLQRLVDKRSGITLLRRANRTAHKDSVLYLLREASTLLEGWTMLYPEIAKSYYRNGYEEKAVDVLANRLAADSLFVGFLPSCYFLKANERYQQLIAKREFDLHNWLEAVYALIDFGMNEEAIKVGTRLIDKYEDCSYLHFLVGKAYRKLKDGDNAMKYYQTAVRLDAGNMEAKSELDRLKKK